MPSGSNFFTNIVGNDALKKRLSSDVAENHLSHAYVIEGPRGSGKHTVAKSVAAAIECERRESAGMSDLFGGVTEANIPCGVCLSCEKILGDRSPDVITVGLPEDRVTIGVESIRDMKDEMYTAPNDLSVKVFIIEDADLMTEQAQNALLLSLEEPPEYIIFFLLCENSSNLLETIRSRAPTLRTVRISEREIGEYLLTHDKRAIALKNEDEEAWRALLFIANGSIGYAIDLLDARLRNRIMEHRSDTMEIISLISHKNRAEAFGLIPIFGTKRKEIVEKLAYLQYAIRDLLLLKKDENAPLCFFIDREAAQELSTHFTSISLLTVYDATVAAVKDFEANANVRLTLMNLLKNAALI